MIFGIDDSVLSRALDGRPARRVPLATSSTRVDGRLRRARRPRVTPIDHGEVCLNVDRAWFADARPRRRRRRSSDLTLTALSRTCSSSRTPRPRRRASRSCSRRSRASASDGWEGYWRELRANGVLAVDGWEEAYTQQFSGAAGSPGKRPIVVSYATSPAAEVIFAAKPLDDGADRRDRGRLLPPGRVRRRSCAARANEDGAQHADRLHALRALPGRRPRLDVRLSRPARASRCRDAFVEHAIVPDDPLEPSAGGDRREPRPLGRRVDRDRRALSRSRGVAAIPLAFLAVFFAWPLAAILERSLVRRRSGSTCRSTCSTRASTREVAWFTLWQATCLDGADARRRRCPLAWALARFSVPRPLARRGARARPVRPPHGRRRDGVPRAPARRARAVGLGDPPRPRLLQRRRRRPRRRRVLGRARRPALGRGRDARRAAASTASRLGHAAAPRARRSRRAASIVFLFCFTSFGVIVVLGGIRYATLESEIYNQAARLFDLRTAAALALLQLAAVAADGARLRTGSSGGSAARRRRGRPGAPARSGASASHVGAVVGCLARAARATAARARRTARCASATATASSTSARSRTRRRRCSSSRGTRSSTRFSSPRPRRRSRSRSASRRPSPSRAGAARSTRSLMLPLGASAAMLGFGFLLAFDDPPLDLRSSPVIVPIAQALVALPFVVRSLVPALRRSTSASARRRPCSARRPAASGARSTCRSSPGRSRSRRASRSPSRSASSARPCSSRARTGRPCPSRSSASSAAPARTTSARAMALCVVLMALVAAVALALGARARPGAPR